MALTTTQIVVGGLIASAIGGGVAAYNSFQTAATQRNVANYNYAMQQKNARMQLMSNQLQVKQMETQSRLQKAQAEINSKLAESEAQARANNAQSIRNQAEAQAGADRENIRRGNLDAQREIARMRASQAKSGGQLDAGSMLETEVEAERAKAGIAEEAHYQSELGRRKSFAEAALEDFGADMSRAGAQLDLATGLAEADLTRSAAAFKQVEGRSQYIMDQKRATIARVSGMADARGSQLSGWGTLFQTAGSVASGWGNWQSIGSSYGAVQKMPAGGGRSITDRPPGLY